MENFTAPRYTCRMSLKAALALSCFLFCGCTLSAPYAGRTFYVDPALGSMSNDGSEGSPWSTLQEVVEAGLIESWEYKAHPAVDNGPMRLKNEGAPVRGGDTIVLRGGYHGSLSLTGYYNLRDLTIRAEEGQTPQLSFISLMAVSRVVIQGLTISPSFSAIPFDDWHIVDIDSGRWWGSTHDVTLEGCHIYTSDSTVGWTGPDWDANAVNGIWVNGKNITVRNNRCRNVDFGIQVLGEGHLISGNTVDGFIGDGLRGLGNDQVFERNVVKNSYIVNGNHCDGFQSWATDNVPIERITLRGNTIINWDNPVHPGLTSSLQGIGCFDGPYRDWVIENNLVITDMYHGITLSGAYGCRIVNNTVVDLVLGNELYPWIAVTDRKDGTPSEGCLIRNNICPSVLNEGQQADHNLILGRDAADYSPYFVDPAALDFRLSEGSSARDAGYYRDVSFMDITGALRPRGGAWDLGAFEY